MNDDELRKLACRAYNGFVAELCAPELLEEELITEQDFRA